MSIVNKHDSPAAETDDEEEDEAKSWSSRRKGGGEAGGGGGGGGGSRSCQADNCTADMAAEKPYHRRHRVCEFHAKAVGVLLDGSWQRFCQQCSRFHGLSEFDDVKRSCRRRLAGHNERRRKSTSDSH